MAKQRFESRIEDNAWKVLEALALRPRDGTDDLDVSGDELAEETGLSAAELNDSVTLLVQAGFAEWIRLIGTAPYAFGFVSITPRGRYEYEKPNVTKVNAGAAQAVTPAMSRTIIPPSPVGSPFGFRDDDWETVTQRKGQRDALFVVFGYQFESPHYDSKQLLMNLERGFELAVEEYNKQDGAIRCVLNFRPLAAGYGEHLFNEIARDIIASDIAVFEASDLNPNVMVELGVALTWGVRVLPIKVVGRPAPPSDISGQTWADYSDNGSTFADTHHLEKLIRMIERAVRKKGRA